VALRNIDTVPVIVTPVVKFIHNGTLTAVTLPVRRSEPGESLTIDFTKEQGMGHLPSDFQQGSLELSPDTDRASIVAELFNLSQSGGYVIGPSLTSYPTRSTVSVWRTDESFQTTIAIENTAEIDDHVSMVLYSDHGVYRKMLSIPAGQLMKVNLGEFQQKAIPDDNGSLLVATRA
jgi:hypothetical protein